MLRRLELLQQPPSGGSQAAARPGGGSAASPAPGDPPAPGLEAYKPGALAVVRIASKDPTVLATIPASSVGGFVYTGGSIPFTDIGTRGVRYTGVVGAEIQGW